MSFWGQDGYHDYDVSDDGGKDGNDDDDADDEDDYDTDDDDADDDADGDGGTISKPDNEKLPSAP